MLKKDKESLPRRSPVEVVEEFLIRLEERRLAQFGTERIEAAKAKRGETPDVLRQRLLDLYPDDDHQLFIISIFDIAEAAMIATAELEESTHIPEVVRMFPKDLNPEFYEDREKSDLGLELIMTREAAVPVKAAYHNINLLIEKREKEIIEERKDLIRQGKDLPATSRLGKIRSVVLRRIMLTIGSLIDEDEMNRRVEASLDKTVTVEYLGLQTAFVREVLKDTYNQLPGPFDPTLLYANLVALETICGDMGVYFNAAELVKVYLNELFGVES